MKLILIRYRIFIILPILLVIGFMVTTYINNYSAKSDSNENQQQKKVNSEEFTFISFGDSGNGSREQKSLAMLITNQNPDVVIHNGDLAYDSGTYEEIENNVLNIYQELFRNTEFYPSLGNHDYLTENGKPFVETFDLPGNERYYHFYFKNTLFIALDTNTPLDEKPDVMINWLDSTLSEESGKARWVIVYFHHSPYSTGKHGSDLRVREKLVPIFEKHPVDIVFSGHDHNYQRTCKILEGKCDDNGVLYIVSGGGGKSLYEVGEARWFTQKQVSAHHFIKGEVKECGLNIKAIDINENTLDSFSLSKC